MYKPIHPCKDCTNRGNQCISCPAWAEYVEKRNAYYHERKLESIFISSRAEKYNKLCHRNLKFKKGIIR